MSTTFAASAKPDACKNCNPGSVSTDQSRAHLKMDQLSSKSRSALMRSVRQRNTTPELRVRSAAHRLGYRYRLHRADLPGTPDVVFPSRRLCLFVHGCFWHHHQGCRYATMPKSRVEYWDKKFQENIKRDNRNRSTLADLRWTTVVIWECETRNPKQLEMLLVKLLNGRTNNRTSGGD